MLDECTVRAVRKIRRPNIHDGRLLITYSINLVELGNVHEACMVSLVHEACMVSLVHGACMVSLVTGMGRVWSDWCMVSLVHGACMVSLVTGMGRVWSAWCMVSLVHGACMVSLVTGMRRVWSSMEVSKRSVNRGYHVYKVGLDDLPWV